MSVANRVARGVCCLLDSKLGINVGCFCSSKRVDGTAARVQQLCNAQISLLPPLMTAGTGRHAPVEGEGRPRCLEEVGGMTIFSPRA